MRKVIKKIIKDKKGEGYVDVAVLVLAIAIVIVFIVKTIPAFIVKDQLNNMATKMIREAELQGKINIDYSHIADALQVEPDSVKWEAVTLSDNRVQFNEKITVTCTGKVDIGLFGNFGSFPITLTSKSTGRSEVYWK